jgi:hypothetical protein
VISWFQILLFLKWVNLCRYAECADAAALQLAAALRADAEAVINPDVTPEVGRGAIECS